MAWPVEALMLLLALGAAWAAVAALYAAWRGRTWPLAVVGLAVIAGLGAEVGVLNGSWGPSFGSGVAMVSVLAGGVALAALAIYLLLPPPELVDPGPPPRPNPALNPDSEA